MRTEPLGDDADRLDGRHGALRELSEQPVLAFRNPDGQLLQRVERAVQLHEAHDVAADAALRVDEDLRGPLLERQSPGKLEERLLVRACAQPKVSPRGRHAGPSGGSGAAP